jgi:hypothetical protein
MSFEIVIASQHRDAKRPALATDLLLHIIAPDPFEPGATMDPQWAEEHALKPRFFVGGLPWFRSLTLLNAEGLGAYRKHSSNRAKSIGWADMKGLPRHVVSPLYKQWESIAWQQYYEAIQQRPVTFVKAALFLLSCELALQELIDTQKLRKRPSYTVGADGPEVPKEISSGEAVYQHMAIVPACWNVNDFNIEYINGHMASDSFFLKKLGKHTKQNDADVFTDLGSGHTVTFTLAQQVKEFCDKLRPPVREIRCRVGKGKLGSRRASKREEPVHLTTS